MTFIATLILDFFVSMGMVLGGSLLGGLGSALTHGTPMTTMVRLSDQLKIWAMVSTLGGTMDTLHIFERGVLGKELDPLGRQITYLIAAFIGCQAGALLVRWIAGEVSIK